MGFGRIQDRVPEGGGAVEGEGGRGRERVAARGTAAGGASDVCGGLGGEEAHGDPGPAVDGLIAAVPVARCLSGGSLFMHHARVFPHGGVCRNRAEQSRAVREAWGAEGEDAAVLPKCAAVYPGGLLGVLSQWRSAGSHRQRRLASQARAGGRWGARRLACPQSAHGRPEQLASGASVSERRRDEKRARDRVPRWTICSTGDPPRRVGGGGGVVCFFTVCVRVCVCGVLLPSAALRCAALSPLGL